MKTKIIDILTNSFDGAESERGREGGGIPQCISMK